MYLQLTVKNFQKIFHTIKDEIAKPWIQQSTDSLYLLNAIKDKYPTVMNESFFSEHLGTRNIICEESLEELCNLLLVSFATQ